MTLCFSWWLYWLSSCPCSLLWCICSQVSTGAHYNVLLTTTTTKSLTMFFKLRNVVRSSSQYETYRETLKDDLDIKQDDFMYCGWVLLMYSSVCLYEMIACVLGGQVIGRWFWLTDHRFHLHNKEHLTHLPSRITPPSTAWAKSTRPDDLTSGMRAQLDVHQFSSLSLSSVLKLSVPLFVYQWWRLPFLTTYHTCLNLPYHHCSRVRNTCFICCKVGL